MQVDEKNKTSNIGRTIKKVLVILSIIVCIFALIYAYAEYQAYKENERIAALVEKEMDRYKGIDFSNPQTKENMDKAKVALDNVDIGEIASKSIDDMKIKQLKSAERVYVVYDLDKGIGEPYFRGEGTIDVSDSEKYVPSTTLNGEFVGNLTTKAFSQQEFVNYLNVQADKGITQLQYWEYSKEFSEVYNKDSFSGTIIDVASYLE